MVTEIDINRMKDFCVSVLDLQNATLNDEYYYQSLPLCVIDSVFSIGVKYEGTKRTVIKYCDHYGLQRIKSDKESLPSRDNQESIDRLIEKMESEGTRFFAENIFRNRQRTSARKGILKSDAVLQFAKVLQKYDVNYFQDVGTIVKNAAFESDVRKIKGQSSGVALKYFLMLSGSSDFIKPDRWIKAFIYDAIAKQLDNQDCQELLVEVCERLNLGHPDLTPRLLDNKIWVYQRAKKNGKKKNTDKLIPVNNMPSATNVTKRITGKIVCPDTDRREITIHKNQDHGLLLQKGERVPITLIIDGAEYKAGVRLTSTNVPWICPDLCDLSGEKIALADALRKACMEKGQKVVLLQCDADKTFSLSKEENKMFWWDVILEKIKVGNVLTTPGRGMEGLRRRPFSIEDENVSIIDVHSGESRIRLEKKCFDVVEEAFQQNADLYLYVASVKTIPALPGSADELIRNATGSQLARGNYVCAMLEHCGLVKYAMRSNKKVIMLP